MHDPIRIPSRKILAAKMGWQNIIQVFDYCCHEQHFVKMCILEPVIECWWENTETNGSKPKQKKLFVFTLMDFRKLELIGRMCQSKQ